MTSSWQQLMRRALALAKKGYGNTGPNPRVGAVVVRDGKVVGEGFHQRVGGPHAEAMALERAGRAGAGADLVVTLEPCSRYGRTPPCTDRILKAGVKRVVIGCRDPNPAESGRGTGILRERGVEVLEGVEEERCRRLNEAYSRYITKGRPFVTLKLAVSIDGRIATSTGDARWVSSPPFGRFVHRLRRDANAVMVGAGTVRGDDPELTVRLARPDTHPLRVVVSGNLDLPDNLRLFREQDSDPTLVFTTTDADPEAAARLARNGIEVMRVAPRAGKVDLAEVIAELGSRGVSSLLVEGGGQLAGSLLARSLAHRLVVAHAPVVIGAKGRPAVGFEGYSVLAEAPRYEVEWSKRMGPDLVVAYRPELAGGER